MNPESGQMFAGDPEFLKEMEKSMCKALTPVPRKSFNEVEEMSMSERKAWAK